MEIYCADIRGLDESRAIIPGRSRSRGSAFAASLLLFAARRLWGADALPAFGTDALGRPYFPEKPEWRFSLSHTSTHVLAAVSPFPVGADVEFIKPLSGSLAVKLTTERERADFSFFETWVLRESLFKLNGGGSLRTARFFRENGVIIPPVDGVFCRLYGEVPGCAAAVCSRSEAPPESVVFVSGKDILR